MVRKRKGSGESSDFTDDAPPPTARNKLATNRRVHSSDSDRSSTPSPPKQLADKVNGKKPARPRAQPAPLSSDSSADEGQRPRSPFRNVSLNGHGANPNSASPARARKRLSARPSDLRRQSFQNTANLQPTPTANGSHGTALPKGTAVATTLGKGPPPKVGLLATTAARRYQARQSSGFAGLNPNEISREVMASNYEEWMKMATDNKINATNTWNTALIDYFADMSLLRNTDGDGSINFQKASCTLDGCVKIWTSRVDSVIKDTGKLLSGLAEDGSGLQEDDEDGEEGQNEGDDGVQRQQRRKNAKKAETLVDFDKHMIKKFDLEVSVDPLFKKTAADFDEGGAGGILMNHLGCDSNMRIIFDASDARLEDGSALRESEGQSEDGVEVDLSQLRSALLPDIDEIDELDICPSMSSFTFSSDPNINNLDLFKNNLASSLSGGLYANNDQPQTSEGNMATGSGDFFDRNEQAFMPDYEGAGNYGADGFDDDDDNAENGANFFAEEPEALDPRRPPPERDLVMAFAKEGDNQIFDYFDAALTKNWAGPQHWKMHRTLRRIADEDAAANKPKRAPREKVEFSIDFAAPSSVSSKQLFESGTRASTTLAKSKRNVNEDHLLPEDIGFSSQQLLRLFIKPKAVLNVRRKGRLTHQALGEDLELDEHYWAEAAAANAAEGNESSNMEDGAGMPLPFATQFFDNENDFGPDYDDDAMGDDVGALDAPTPGPDDVAADADSELLAAMQTQTKRVRPEHVSYAKKAKRVDVRKLKENIWRELSIEADAVPAPTPVAAEQTPAAPLPSSAEGAKTFTNVLTGLRRIYPQDKMEEISTSFCFICLLHLANEQGLRIGNDRSAGSLKKPSAGSDNESDVDDEEDEGEPRLYVGDLSALSIIRESYATVSVH